MKKITLFAATAVLATGLMGCETATNTNVRTNANGAAVNGVNSNTAVVVNTSNMETGRTNTNSSAVNYNVSRADYDKDRVKYEAEKGASTIGQGANDSWIWFKTKAALTAVNDLRDSTINVDVANDVITLRGSVATAAQKTQAETAAKSIEGQKGVKNELKVQAGDSLTNQAVTDSDKPANTSANANKK